MLHAPPPETLALSACYCFDGDFLVAGRPLRLDPDRTSASLKCTGTSVWDAAIILAKLLEQQPKLLHGCSGEACVAPKVLDLGTGLGTAGLAAALLGADVVLTDMRSLAHTVEQSIELNSAAIAEAGGSARFAPLDWSADPPDELPPGSFDVLLAADPVWREEQAPVFAATVRRVLTEKTGCMLLLARSDRTCVPEAASALFSALAAQDLALDAFEQSQLDHPELPLSGRHFVQHGVVKIWRARCS
eukprot:gnl/TRDRNA2_/TRDRNA2_202119_c0_seq1.p1 gnl/TRDRNA2_/TRDRNA2_202119_c0~~gnl/TRDRNA2_/TRDRNA2_202119_c0_seq1.p1  ORF type:complete len:246 (+),score=43.47 gnl/TRDRNA2_/TRDRNA2_202119_c0_seq1:116-853(+)